MAAGLSVRAERSLVALGVGWLAGVRIYESDGAGNDQRALSGITAILLSLR
jgi:hypothetical protein